jgi:outer membrane biosynthesis protein TonB
MTSKPAIAGGDLLRAFTALGLTAGLLLFLVGMRLTRTSHSPELTLRTLSTISPVSLPAPPPPPAAETPPPPPPPDLPRLEIQLDPVAPPVKASLVRDVELRLNPSDFAPVQDAPLAQMVFSAKDLDTMPKLVNRPSIVFPANLRAKGVKQVKVVLDVNLSPGGIVTVQRVLESPSDDFTAVARSYATKARFTPPKKDGRSVQASFRWPLILKL